jgi:hypothetical protein
MPGVVDTKQNLIDIEADITAQEAASKAFAFLNSFAIKRFRDINADALNEANAARIAVLDEYVAKDEFGFYIILDPGPPVVYQMIDEGTDDEFALAMEEAMNQKVTIYY